MKNSILIGVCGGSGSGKTSLANYLKEKFKDDLVVLQYDSYCVDRSNLSMEERNKINYDLPDSYDAKLFLSHIKKLLDNKPVKKPIFDFATHTRTKDFELIEPRRIVLVEGIMVFQLPDIEKYADLLIYVDTDADIRLARRILRDIKERGRTVDSVINQYISTVKPSHYLYIEPKKVIADVVFENNKNDGLNINELNKIVDKIKTL